MTYADVRWARCDVKAIALVTNVMAKQYAVSRGAFEAIFVRDGALTEGAHTNVFGVIDGVIRTYPRSQYILPGVTREVVLEVAEERGYTVSELPIMAEDTSRLEELFFTGTATDVLPVVTLDGRPVADGSPGPIARGL